MADSSQVPGYTSGKYSAVRGSSAFSGTRDGGSDPTNEPGQYPVDDGAQHGIFGGTLPDGTGAPGTAGASGTADPTNEPGQLEDGLTGITTAEITQTGAPGTQGSTFSGGAGSDAVTFTRPGSYLSGSYAEDTVRDSVTGAGDWTQANDDGYGSGGPQLPGIKGNEPQAGGSRFQPGGGHVMRGGRAVRG